MNHGLIGFPDQLGRINAASLFDTHRTTGATLAMGTDQGLRLRIPAAMGSECAGLIQAIELYPGNRSLSRPLNSIQTNKPYPDQ